MVGSEDGEVNNTHTVSVLQYNRKSDFKQSFTIVKGVMKNV